jgi:hypothetical protein
MSRPSVSFVKASLLLGTLLLGASPVLAGAGYRWTPPPPPPRVSAPAPAPVAVRTAPLGVTVSITVTPARSSAGGPAAKPETVVLRPGESVTIYPQPATSPQVTASRITQPRNLP